MSEIPEAQVGTLELYRMLTRVEDIVKALDDKLDKHAITTAEHELRIKLLEANAAATKNNTSTLRVSILASIPASLIAGAFVVLQIVLKT